MIRKSHSYAYLFVQWQQNNYDDILCNSYFKRLDVHSHRILFLFREQEVLQEILASVDLL